MTRVPVKPELLRWACERAGKPESALAEKFSGFTDWLTGEKAPTFKQLEDFAKATHTPIGFFFLQKPPVENVPIPDFRTIDSAQISRPSVNLLDTIYLCQQRQDWFRQHALLMGDEPLRFVGSVSTNSDVLRTAAKIRASLDLDARPLAQARNADDAVGLLMARLDELGVLVMVSGVVGNNTHRPLDPGEFRGFALSDDLAPLIFVNGADTKAGQIFTLAHEVAHLWIGESGVSDVTPASSPSPRRLIEYWCNAVAAEVLVPLASFKRSISPSSELFAEMERLSAIFRVSTLVVLRRMRDAGHLSKDDHASAHRAELARLRDIMRQRKERAKGGGDFYNTSRYRLSPRFATAVISSTYEGRSTFTEAFRLLGCRNVKTLENLGHSLNLANPSWSESGVD